MKPMTVNAPMAEANAPFDPCAMPGCRVNAKIRKPTSGSESGIHHAEAVVARKEAQPLADQDGVLGAKKGAHAFVTAGPAELAG